MTQEQHFTTICRQASDINEHLPVLREYASRVNHITEMGVRSVVSTFAFLMGKPKKLVSIDIQHPSVCGGNGGKNLELAKQYADEANIDFIFQLADTRVVDIEPTEFLFIDTWHVYEQCKAELDRHHDKVSTYIGFHDTTTFADRGETVGHMGLWKAIEEFIAEHPEWKIDIRKTNNNGLTILKKQ